MFYSKKYNLLYIASPKSGSVSVQRILETIDPNGEKSTITLNGKKITAKEMYYGVKGHARAWEIKRALGEETTYYRLREASDGKTSDFLFF